MVRVFLTGATGLLGAHLVPRLLARDYELSCLVPPGTGDESLPDPRIHPVEGHLHDVDALRRGIRGADFVINAASIAMSSDRGPEQMWQVHALGTERLARIAREEGAYRYLQVSSALSLAASRRPKILDENASGGVERLRNGYIRSRRAGDLAVQKEVRRGLCGLSVHPTVFFGPNCESADGSLLGVAARGRLKAIPPGGLNIVDVRDVADGCLNALDFGLVGERYILGGRNFTHRDLLQALVRATGQRMPRLRIPTWSVPLLAHGVRLLEAVKNVPPPLNSQCLRAWGTYFWYSSQKAQEEIGYRNVLATEASDLGGVDWDRLIGSPSQGIGI